MARKKPIVRIVLKYLFSLAQLQHFVVSHIQTVHTVHPLPSNSSIKQESQKRKAQEIEVEIKSSHQTKNLRRMTINQKLQN